MAGRFYGVGAGGGSGRFYSGKSSLSKEPLSLEQLRSQVARLEKADPKRKSTFQQALAPFKSVARGALSLLDLPRKAVFEGVVQPLVGEDVKTGADLAKKLGIKGFGGKALGFGLDVGLDPLTYATFGTSASLTAAKSAALGAAGKTVLREGIESAAKKAGKDYGEFVVGHKALQPVAKRIGEAKSKSELTKIIREQGIQAPTAIQGGLRLHVPFSKKYSAPIIKGGKIAPVTGAIRGKAGKAVSAVTAWSPAEKSLEGLLATRTRQLLEVSARTLRSEGRHLLNETSKAFKPGTPDADILRGALNGTVDRATLSTKQAGVLEKWDAYREKLRATALKSGIDLGEVDDYFHRTLSAEGKKARYGEGGLGSGRAPKEPGYAKGRKFETFEAAQAEQSRRLGVEKALEEDPFKAMDSYIAKVTQDSVLHGLAKAGERAKYFLPPVQLSKHGVNLGELKAAGFADPRDALHLIISGTADPRLAKLSEKTLAGLQAHRAETIPKLVASEQTAVRRIGSSKKLETTLIGALDKRRTAALKAEEQLATHQASIEAATRQIGEARLQVEGLTLEFNAATGQAKQALGKELRKAKGDLKRLEGAVEKETSQALQVAARVGKRGDEVVETQERLVRQQERLRLREQELENVRAGNTRSGKKWPIGEFEAGAVPEGFRQLNNTALGALNGKIAPVELADELERYFSRASRGTLATEWDRFLATFKKWVTVPYPGFHARNTFGGWFNNYLGGVRLRHAADFERIASGKADLEVFEQYGGRTGAELNQMLIDQGIHSTREAPHHQLAEFLEEGGARPRGFGVRGLQQFSEGVEKVGGFVMNKTENFLRGSAFLSGLEQLGDPYAARMFTMMRHGDYEELTNFERQYLRRYIPFYKWMRTNIPLQLSTLAHNPAKVSNFYRFQNQVIGDPELRARLEAEGKLPKGAELGLGAIVGGPVAKFLGGSDKEPLSLDFGLPFADINNLFPEGLSPGSLAKGLLSQTAPPIKAGVEAAFGQNLYTGQSLREMQPARGAVGRAVGSFLEANPLTKRFTARSKSGELRVDGRVLNVLSALPSSRWSNATEQLLGTVTGGEAGREGLTSTLFGIRPQVQTESRQQGALYDRQESVDRLVQELYRLGYGEEFKATAPKKKKRTRSRRQYSTGAF